MKKTKYCSACGRHVRAEKRFSLGWCIFTGGLYLPYYLLFKKKDSCPICGTKCD